MDDRNKILETLCTQKSNSFAGIENEVKTLKTELRETNLKIDSLLHIMTIFFNEINKLFY